MEVFGWIGDGVFIAYMLWKARLSNTVKQASAVGPGRLSARSTLMPQHHHSHAAIAVPPSAFPGAPAAGKLGSCGF
jgi:hypothetical protein